MNKIEVFKEELEFIKDDRIKSFATNALDNLPDYFFSIASSSTGKYHSQYALGEGGLVRHVKACVRIAVELFRLEWWNFTEEEKDIMLVALLLHDGYKSGFPQQKYTAFDHPLVAVEQFSHNEALKELATEKQFDLIMDCISSHMGYWSKDRSGVEVLPKPKTQMQKLVHMADYICSRKCLEFNFNVEIKR